jgi:hypothetical protein
MANRKTVQRVYQAESSRFPLRQFGVIKIYGTDNFVLRVSASLELEEILCIWLLVSAAVYPRRHRE